MNTKDWETININRIFDISYGNKLDMCQMLPSKNGIPFITRTGTNNGVGGYVEILPDETSNNAGSLSIALGGSIGSTFLQSKDFYTSQNVAVLSPKCKISNNIKIFLAHLIEQECQMKFCAFGRELNKHIKVDFTIKLPFDTSGNPDWQWIENYVQNTLIPKLPQKVKSVWQKQFDTTPLSPNKLKLNTKEWKWFYLTDVFSLKGGKRLTKPEREKGTIPLITAGRENEGVAEYISNEEQAKYKNAITIDMFGFSCYRGYEFCCDDNILVLQNKHLTCFSGLFISSIISNDEYKCAYGRQYRQKTFMVHKIKLPADLLGNPDWQWMEDYIKGLPYSGCL